MPFCEILKEVDFYFVSSNPDINTIESNLKSILLQSAKLEIPVTKLLFNNGFKRPKKDHKCRLTVQAIRKTFKMFQKHPSQSTAISYKQSCAKVKLV